METLNSLTPSQQLAVAARGNVLVMAGAGTGKTHTLVERCLNLICEEKVSLDEILIVTFTEAAATEMRERLREGLEAMAQKQVSEVNLQEQLALFDAAHIGTLHGFCFKLIREHFHELDLDPQLTVLDEGQARLLSDEMLEEQFHAHYEKEDEFSLAVQDLIRVYGSGRDGEASGRWCCDCIIMSKRARMRSTGWSNKSRVFLPLNLLNGARGSRKRFQAGGMIGWRFWRVLKSDKRKGG